MAGGGGREGRGERYTYEETGVMPVVVIDAEKGETHKTGGYISLYAKRFKAGTQK